LPLLRGLTEATSDWAVWKNAESALTGTGDVDSAAPRSAWPVISQTYLEWAAAQQLGPAIVCRHIPRTLNLLAMLPDDTALLQLEVKGGATWRGSLQFDARDVLALSKVGDQGFRRLRPGAEGLLKLLNNGTVRGGAPNWDGIRSKDVEALLRDDPEGVAAMARHFGPARGSLLRAVDAVLAGRWDRRAVASVEAWAVTKALVQPHVVTERIWFRAVRKPTCPVLHVVYRKDRRVQGDVDAWLAKVRTSHVVVGSR
jgi:hypothetical protein